MNPDDTPAGAPDRTRNRDENAAGLAHPTVVPDGDGSATGMDHPTVVPTNFDPETGRRRD